jgi:aspartyl-tRNA(Asn)/glutamyl-tRNA(Gln) amidotransferase subunit C
MSVDTATVKRIARLARLAIDDEQAAHMERELNAILSWVEQLKEVDIAGVPPLTSVVEQKLKMRSDEVTDGGYPDDLMKNAPQSENHFFVVPKVVE